MRRITMLVAAAFAAALVAASPAAASKHRPHDPAGNIVETAVAASGPSAGTPDGNPHDFDILIAAVLDQNLAGALSSAPALTVFAPTDAAFQRLVADLTGSHPTEAQAAAAVTALPDAVLTNVLTYHVVGRALSPVRVVISRQLTALNGGTIKPRGINLRDENDAFADPRLLIRAIGIRATNGYIHAINRVLLPDPLAP